MALSYTPALERDSRRARTTTMALSGRHAILPATSGVVLLAMGLALAGRLHTASLRDEPSGATPVNVNEVADASAIEPALRTAIPHDPDRRLAARRVFSIVKAHHDAGRDLPNVGALAVALPPDTLAAAKPFISVRGSDAYARVTVLCGAVLLAAFYGVLFLWSYLGMRGDVVLLSTAHLLTGIGFALLVSRADPLRDTLLFIRYTAGVVIGAGMLALASVVDFRKAAFARLTYVPLVAALALSATLVIFGDGPGASRARVNLGPVQPIEAIRLLLAFFLAGYFARRWELLRQMRTRAIGDHRVPAWLNLPRVEYTLPLAIGVVTAWLFFVLQRDLGPALVLACVFLALYAVARARVAMAMTGLACLAAGFYAGHRLQISDTLTARAAMWLSPWDNLVRGGDQVAQSLWAVSTGGWLGAGLGFGDTQYLPAGHTDLVLSAVGEELGIVGLVAVVALYGVVTLRGFQTALRAADDYGFFLAAAITVSLAIPALTMASGVFGLTPLTGVVTPLLSYGGSAMVANLAALGVLVAIGARSSGARDMTPFRRPTLALGGALAAAAVVLIAAMGRVAVVQADALAIRPHLSLQADGVRRYQHNPRLLDVVRRIPRGTVYDRRGLPLATSEAGIIEQARVGYATLGLALDETCTMQAARCYPLGGSAFHVLGDDASRVNWSASNTSFVERDADAVLRGFDDHAESVSIADADGRQHATLRRDYRALLPLLRHRYDPRHSDVRAFLDRSRDVRLTVDAALQSRVAAILARHAAKSTTGRAAAVVIDSRSGGLLAVASYPFPSLNGHSIGEADSADVWLDRARYGLYAPGSTFKLVTAAAALDQGLRPSELTFVCGPLRDGRVGARIPGWSRPVRDDVRDTRPHGALRLHDAFVHSCNAYFAQLAVRVGARSLQDVATRLGMSTAPGSSLPRLRETLPQAGYGQGDVVTTPLRMARAVAAVAAGGVLRDVVWETPSTERPAGRLLSGEASSVLAEYLRDSVLSGTGRSLRGHPLRIAGKTGTAEVAGAASHAWFVGFAPFAGADPPIAFAVIVENAGYGASAAAPIAGEIVSAAADVGLIR